MVLTASNWTIAISSHIEVENKWPHFVENIFKCIFLYENLFCFTIALKFVPSDPIASTGSDNGLAPQVTLDELSDLTRHSE